MWQGQPSLEQNLAEAPQVPCFKLFAGFTASHYSLTQPHLPQKRSLHLSKSHSGLTLQPITILSYLTLVVELAHFIQRETTSDLPVSVFFFFYSSSSTSAAPAPTPGNVRSRACCKPQRVKSGASLSVAHGYSFIPLDFLCISAEVYVIYVSSTGLCTSKRKIIRSTCHL